MNFRQRRIEFRGLTWSRRFSLWTPVMRYAFSTFTRLCHRPLWSWLPTSLCSSDLTLLTFKSKLKKTYAITQPCHDHVMVIGRESNKTDRWIKEAIYTRKDDMTTNRDKGSYQLCHVYDKLFATVATSSGEWKSTTSFQRRQLLLPKCQQ